MKDINENSKAMDTNAKSPMNARVENTHSSCQCQSDPKILSKQIKEQEESRISSRDYSSSWNLLSTGAGPAESPPAFVVAEPAS